MSVEQAKVEAKPKAEKKEKAPKPEKPKIPAITEKDRKALMEIKIDKEQAKKLLDSGVSVWDVTEKLYGRQFDHSDRKTWVFYQKVNTIRKGGDSKEAVNTKVNPQVVIAISEYLKTHSQEELLGLLAIKKV